LEELHTPAFVMDATQFIIEPRDLWSRRVAAQRRETAPRVIAMPDGGEGWAFEGGAWLRPLGLEVCAGRSPLDVQDHGFTYAGIRPGMYDAKARIADMDLDEVDVAALFPTYAMDVRSILDPELHVDCVRAYNDAVWEWAREGDPARLVAQALIPAVGLDAAMAELGRAAKAGFRGIVFWGWPAAGERPQPAEDRFWSLCAEAGIAINLVRGGPLGADRTPVVPSRYAGPKAAGVRVTDVPPEVAWAQNSGLKNTNITWIILTGILDRFPSLQVALHDCGAGWLPTAGELLDWLYRYEQFMAFAKLKHMPSVYIRRQVRATFNGERSTLAARREFGEGALLWSSDYPNHTSTWPSSRQTIDDQLSGIPAVERRRILGENCAALYRVAARPTSPARV